jgi:hypothetical protein
LTDEEVLGKHMYRVYLVNLYPLIKNLKTFFLSS